MYQIFLTEKHLPNFPPLLPLLSANLPFSLVGIIFPEFCVRLHRRTSRQVQDPIRLKVLALGDLVRKVREWTTWLAVPFGLVTTTFTSGVGSALGFSTQSSSSRH